MRDSSLLLHRWARGCLARQEARQQRLRHQLSSASRRRAIEKQREDARFGEAFRRTHFRRKELAEDQYDVLQYAMDPRQGIHRANRIDLISGALAKMAALHLTGTHTRIPEARRAALKEQGRERLAQLLREEDCLQAMELASEWRATLLARDKEGRAAGGSSAIGGGGEQGGGKEDRGGVFFTERELLEWLEKRKPLPKVLRAPAGKTPTPLPLAEAAAAAAVAEEEDVAVVERVEEEQSGADTEGGAENGMAVADASFEALMDSFDSSDEEGENDPDKIYTVGRAVLLSQPSLAAKVLRLPGSWPELYEYDASWLDDEGAAPRYSKQAWDELGVAEVKAAVQDRWDGMAAAQRAKGVTAAWELVPVAMRSAPLRAFKKQQRMDRVGRLQLEVLLSMGLVKAMAATPVSEYSDATTPCAAVEAEGQEKRAQWYELRAVYMQERDGAHGRASDGSNSEKEEDESKDEQPASMRAPQSDQPPQMKLCTEEVMEEVLQKARATAADSHRGSLSLMDGSSAGLLGACAKQNGNMTAHVDGSSPVDGEPLFSLNALAKVRSICSDSEFFRHFVFVMQTAGEDMVKISTQRLLGKDVVRLFKLDDSAARLMWESDRTNSTNGIFLCEIDAVEKVGEWPGSGLSETSRVVIAFKSGKSALLRVRPTNAVVGKLLLWGFTSLLEQQRLRQSQLMASSEEDEYEEAERRRDGRDEYKLLAAKRTRGDEGLEIHAVGQQQQQQQQQQAAAAHSTSRK